MNRYGHYRWLWLPVFSYTAFSIAVYISTWSATECGLHPKKSVKNQWFSELNPELDDGGRNVNVYEKEYACV